jgi:hypothetical protein
MASWKCGSCGLFNFVESVSCRRCGTARDAAAPNHPYQQNGYVPQSTPPPSPYAPFSNHPQPYESSHGQQQPYGQAGNWSSGQANSGNAPQPWDPQQANQSPPPPHWDQPPSHHQQPQSWTPQPANGVAQPAAPYANPMPPAAGYPQNPGYHVPSQPDYSQAPSYGAPSAGSYQPSLQMMNNWNQAGVWREGDKLVMHRRAALPDRCIKCNVPTNGSYLHRKLSWIHPLWGLLILASWIIYLVIYYALRKTAEVDLGLCEEHRASRRTGITVGWLMVALGIGAFVFAIVGEALAFLFIGILLLLGGLIWASYAAAVISVTKMDDQYIWMKRVNKDYLAGFPPAGGY